ncbi:hypothetical protein AB0399_32085 [Streptomyces sp. NPDC088194]|uniref:DUF6907 domain-containing protein n=1 Tax=Streptomyces sp. NPDC088194 TaxID=3154931 RepID=UPI0034501179
MNPAATSPSALPPLPPAPAPARRWVITTTTGETITGHLPAWATADPSEHGLPPKELSACLADINHSRQFPGHVLPLYSPANPDGQPTPVEILHGSIDCNPYATAPDTRIPVANLHLAGEYWLTDLDPHELAQLANGLRTLADRLDHDTIPTLIDARTDWTTHHPHTAGARS